MEPSRRPPFTRLLAERATVRVIAVAGLVYGALSATGFEVVPCPVPRLVGEPCPGCGLTRGVGSLLQGDFGAMWEFHAFAPLAAVLLTLVGLSAVLPEGPRAGLIGGVGRLERTRVPTLVIGAGLVIYWVVRVATGEGRALVGTGG